MTILVEHRAQLAAEEAHHKTTLANKAKVIAALKALR